MNPSTTSQSSRFARVGSAGSAVAVAVALVFVAPAGATGPTVARGVVAIKSAADAHLAPDHRGGGFGWDPNQS